MRKNYVKPNLICEEFTPEAYCASCKDNGVTTYSASCDTSGYVFEDTNGNGTFDFGTDQYKNYNSGGDDCSFEISYKPDKKNAFIIETNYMGNWFTGSDGEDLLYNYDGNKKTGIK